MSLAACRLRGLTPPAREEGGPMNRYWLLTSTTYGTWLPGDARGFVSAVEDDPGPRIRHNVPGTPYDVDVPELRQSARTLLKGPPIYLVESQAIAVRDQF